MEKKVATATNQDSDFENTLRENVLTPIHNRQY